MPQPHHPPGPPPFLVSTPATLERLLAALEGQPVVALDTESDGFFRYRPKLCVVQVAVPGTSAVVDMLAGLDLAPLWAVLSMPRVTSILHDAEGDVTYLARDHGVTLGAIFDTAYAARLLGLTQLGLAGLAQSLLGVALDKTEQKSDWARRPLSADQVRYAAADVAHLHAIKDQLQQQMDELGRTPWAHQGFDRVRTRVLVPKDPDPEAWRHVKGALELNEQQRGVLKAAHTWREAVSQRMDMAPFRVMGNDTLLHLARRGPAWSAAELAQVRGAHPSVLRGPDMPRLADMLQSAAPVPGPLFERHEETEEERRLEARFDLLRGWRSASAKQLKMDVGALVSNAALKTLARLQPTSLDAIARTELLLPWQVEHLGTALLAALEAPLPTKGARSPRAPGTTP